MDWAMMSLTELRNSTLYNSLTEAGKQKAGPTKESILRFFGKTLFPFIDTTIRDFVWSQIPLWDEEDVKDLSQEISESLSYKDALCFQGIDTGVSLDIDFLKFVVAFVHSTTLNLGVFIPVHVHMLRSTELEDKSLKSWHDSLFEAFMLARLHYITNQTTYPPVVCNVALDDLKEGEGHTIAYVFFPDIKHKVWTRILIDSSDLIRTEKHYQNFFDQIEVGIQIAWEKYVDRLQDVLTDDERLADKPVLCSHNFQSNLGMCTHWSLALVIHFLYNYQKQKTYLIDKSTMILWCENLESFVRTNRQKMSRVIMEFDGCMNQFLHDFVLTKSHDLPSIKRALWSNNDNHNNNMMTLLSNMSQSIKTLDILDYFSRLI